MSERCPLHRAPTLPGGPSESAVPPTWRLLPLILGLAFAARVAVALSGDFIYHPDVIFQYLEPAWRLLTGEGHVYWEQFYGARSQFIPALLALVFGAFRLSGLTDPPTLLAALEVALCGVSILIPWGMYAFARAVFDERSARVALVLGAAWYELVALAGQPLSELLALPPLLWMAALAADSRTASSASRGGALGLLAVATGALRFQYAPLALFLLAVAWPRLESRPRIRLAIFAAAGVVVIALFDLVSVGSPLFRSYVANLSFNFVFAEVVEDLIAAGGGRNPWPVYAQAMGLAVASAGLAVVAACAAAARPRRTAVPLAFIALTLAIHAASAYKEYRFVLVVVPLWLILLADLLGTLWSRRHPGHRGLACLLGAGFAAACILGLLAKLPGQAAVHGHRWVALSFVGPSDPRLAFAERLARDATLTGLAEIDIPSPYGVGYVHLGGPVPIWSMEVIATLGDCGLEPKDYASHAMVPPEGALPEGFAVLAEDRGWRLARRLGPAVAAPPWAVPEPVVVGGQFGTLARRLFEPPPGTPPMSTLWAWWVGDGAGAIPPRPPFWAFEGPRREAPYRRVAPPPECAPRDGAMPPPGRESRAGRVSSEMVLCVEKAFGVSMDMFFADASLA